MEDSQAIEFLIERLKSTKTNEEFFSAMKNGGSKAKKK
jgi:transcription termination factor Rho